MQLGVGRTVFPGWAAAVTLSKDNGVAAARHAIAAKNADSLGARLDESVLSMASFGHAVDASKSLPLRFLSGTARSYYRGFDAARYATKLLVTSGLIPGAKERFGRQMLVSAQDAFTNGVRVARTDTSRYGAKLGDGWLYMSLRDAVDGVSQLKTDRALAQSLVNGLQTLRSSTRAQRGVDATVVSSVEQLFVRARQTLADELAAAQQATPRTFAGSSAAEHALVARTDALLTQAASDAQGLVDALPGDAA